MILHIIVKIKQLLDSNLEMDLILIPLISIPTFGLPSTSKYFIKNNPKEVLDEVWQIIYRDYMDISNVYSRKKWIKLRSKLLSAKYEDSKFSLRPIVNTEAI